MVRVNGDIVNFMAKEGQTLLDVGHGNLGDEMAGICGGDCECATCHVYVDEPYLGLLDEQDEDETDTLDASADFTPIKANSRLGCQIKLTAALDGMVVRVAPNYWEDQEQTQ